MPKIILRIFSAFFFWGIFILVIFKIPYPQNLSEANLLQISAFFSSLFLAILFTLNIFSNSFYISFSLTLGLILILVLKALESLNLVTAVFVLIFAGLLTSYFSKRNSPTKSNLTKLSKIPTLTRLRKK